MPSVNKETNLSDLQLQVFDLVCSAGWDGHIPDEVEVITGRTHQSISARFNELEKMGLIERRASKRKTRAGRPAWIYVKAGLKRVNKEN